MPAFNNAARLSQPPALVTPALCASVWALPVEAYARFVAGIPAPLGIGTLLLADGTRPKGFLCEAEAIRAAKHISAYGGWRGYVAAEG